MKHLIVIVLAIFSNTLCAQSLIDIYKNGTVKLIPDATYAQGNDWEKVFVNYYDTLYNKPMGERKSIIMTSDGSVIVNHQYRNFYSRFDPNGKFIEEFGIINSAGKQLNHTNPIKGVLNNTFFTGLDNMGNMICFDFTGKYIKTLKLNYMTRDMIPLSNNKFAVVGWVIWATKFRDFVAVVDYDTNEEKIIWDYFTDRNDDFNNEHSALFHYSYRFEKGGAISYTTMPFMKNTGLNSPPQIALVKNQLVITLPVTGEILTYSIDGKLVSKEKITWSSNQISVDEQKEIQKNAIEKFEKNFMFGGSCISEEEIKKVRETILQHMKDDLNRITTPIQKPYFASVIKDSDDNLLFFEMPEETGANKFNVWVYNDGGNFVGQCSFVCDDFNLSITPSKMVFHNGYIYSLQTLKETTGNPLRLVRFKLVGSNN